MNRLKELRQEKGLSQQAIATSLSVNEKTISRWENGESQIKPDKAQQLADYFGVSVGYLLGYDDREYRNALVHGSVKSNKETSQDEINLVATYRLLSLENQKRLKDIAENMVTNQVYTDPKKMLDVLDRYKVQYGENEGITELYKNAELLLLLTGKKIIK